MSWEDPLSYHLYDKDIQEKTTEDKTAETSEFVENAMKGLAYLICGGILLAFGGWFFAAIGFIAWAVIRNILKNRKKSGSATPEC